MNKVLVSEEVLEQLANYISRCISELKVSSYSLQTSYKRQGVVWKDKNYEQLGDIINIVQSKIENICNSLQNSKQNLKKLKLSISNYNETNFNYSRGAGGVTRNNTLNLSSTNQEFTYTTIEGTAVKIFDHPNESVRNATIGQGSCTVNGHLYAGTCGDCSVSTILRRAGINMDEQAVVEYASQTRGTNGEFLCDDEGATSVNSRSEIACNLGCPMHSVHQRELSDLANRVENGYGVIIAVEAGTRGYNPNGWYSGQRGGHAIVLNSVVRDSNTNEIMGYYVIDSNGTENTASVYVSANDLERAFRLSGMRANVTDNIIW